MSLALSSPARRLQRRLAYPLAGAALVLAVLALVRLRDQLPAWQEVSLWCLLVAAGTLWLRGGTPFLGPVFFYDVVRQARRRRVFLHRLLYVGGLFVVLLWTYWRWTLRGDMGALSVRELPRFAESFFFTFLLVQFFVVVALTPSWTAGAIAEEKEGKTLPFLLATDLSGREIVLGKLASRLLGLLMVLLAGLPVFGILQLIGGVDPGLLLAGFAGTGVSLLSLASVSIAWSALLRRSRDAIVFAYLTPPAYLVLAALGSYLGPVVSDVRPVLQAGNPFRAVERTLNALDRGGAIETIADVLRDYLLFHGAVVVGALALAVTGVRRVALREASRPATGPAGLHVPLLGVRPPVSEPPMVWKEVHAEGGLRLHWLARLVLVLLVVLSFLPAVQIILEGRDPSGFFGFRWKMNAWVRTTGTLVACLLLLGIAVRAAGSVSGERSRQTLDGLLTTPLETEEIIYGKWFGSLLSVRWGWLWLGVIWFVGIVTGGLHFLAVVFLLVCGAVYAAFLASLGVWMSVNGRTTLRATVATVAAAAGLSFGHWLLWACCVPLGAAGRATAELAQLQVGLTPPAVLAVLAIEGEEMRGISDTGTVIVGIFIGLMLWGGGAAALLNAANVRFKQLVGRAGFTDPHRPTRSNPDILRPP